MSNPSSKDDLIRAAIVSGVVDEAAVHDAEGYDGGATLAKFDAMYAALQVETNCKPDEDSEVFPPYAELLEFVAAVSEGDDAIAKRAQKILCTNEIGEDARCSELGPWRCNKPNGHAGMHEAGPNPLHAFCWSDAPPSACRHCGAIGDFHEDGCSAVKTAAEYGPNCRLHPGAMFKPSDGVRCVCDEQSRVAVPHAIRRDGKANDSGARERPRSHGASGCRR